MTSLHGTATNSQAVGAEPTDCFGRQSARWRVGIRRNTLDALSPADEDVRAA